MFRDHGNNFENYGARGKSVFLRGALLPSLEKADHLLIPYIHKNSNNGNETGSDHVKLKVKINLNIQLFLFL
jgi:hypothetical protein